MKQRPCCKETTNVRAMGFTKDTRSKQGKACRRAFWRRWRFGCYVPLGRIFCITNLHQFEKHNIKFQNPCPCLLAADHLQPPHMLTSYKLQETTWSYQNMTSCFISLFLYTKELLIFLEPQSGRPSGDFHSSARI